MDIERTRAVLLALFIAVFVFKMLNLAALPFHFDETLYAQMIAEEAESPSFLPTYLGMPAPWKPGLYYFTYSLFLPATSHIFGSLEWVYRFPNLVFGALNAALFYFISKRFVKSDVALAASLLFYASYGTLYAEGRLLMETFMMCMILASLFFYTRKGMQPGGRFLAAGLFALLATFTKTVIAFIILPLAVAYAYAHERKSLTNPFFLVSLTAPLIGMLVFYFCLDGAGLVEDILVNDTGKFFTPGSFDEVLNALFMGLMFFFLMYWAYFGIAFRKMLASYGQFIFFSVWLLAFLIPAFSAEPHPWHFYYIAPPMAFFAAAALAEKGKLDSFSLLISCMLVFSTLAVFILLPVTFDMDERYNEAKAVGLMLSGEKGVLFAGCYDANTVAVAYKALSERERYGHFMDFGYVVLHSTSRNYTYGELNAALGEIISDYNTGSYSFDDGKISNAFQTDNFFRKTTSLKEFRYLVVCPSPNYTVSDPRYTLYYEGNYTSVYVASEKPQPD